MIIIINLPYIIVLAIVLFSFPLQEAFQKSCWKYTCLLFTPPSPLQSLLSTSPNNSYQDHRQWSSYLQIYLQKVNSQSAIAQSSIQYGWPLTALETFSSFCSMRRICSLFFFHVSNGTASLSSSSSACSFFGIA